MKHRYGNGRGAIALFMATSLGAAFFFFALIPAASQNGAARKCLGCSADGKTTPMTADGHPDLNGFWVGAGGGAAQSSEQFQRTADGSVLYDFELKQGDIPLCESDACQAANQPPYNAAYMPRVKAIAKTEFAGTTPLDPGKDCKPAGVPRTAVAGLIVQSPSEVVMVHGDYTDRIIYTDGRPHPKDMEPSYMGNSIGHWEGNTLVVDTAGLNDDTWLGGGGAGDTAGTEIYTSIHSDKEHVIERWTRDGDLLTIETTVEDPGAFTRPWVLAPRRVRVSNDPEAYVNTYYCDAGGVSEALKEHYVKPNPEDRDIKNKCNGHHCVGGASQSSTPAK